MKTTTNIFAAILCAVALMWSGCSKTDEAYEGEGGEQPTAMGVDPTLGSHVDSRAVITGESLPDGASFSLFGYRNDAIYTDGITGKDLNHKQVTYSSVDQTGVFTDDPIYWPASGLNTSPITFYALYPHTAVNTKDYADAAKGDYYISEGTKDGIKFVYHIGDNSDKDLMLAKTTSSAIPSNGAAQLKFYHVLVLLDVQISLDDQRADKTDQINITGITQDGLRVKGMFNQSSFVSGAWSNTGLAARALNLHNGSTSIVLQDDNDDDTYQEVASIMSIPLSASGFGDGKDMTITYTVGSDATPKTLTVSHDKLPKLSEYGKRYKLKINLAAKDALVLLDVKTDVDDWGSKTVNIIHDGQWWLTVTKDVLAIAGDLGAEGSIIAETNYNETTFGYPAGLLYSSISYDGDETDWLSMNVVKDGALKGTMNFTTTKKNDTDEDRVAYVKVTAGNLTKVLTIIQKPALPDIPNPDEIADTSLSTGTYIGAFWRNNQKGERLIKVATSSYPNDQTGYWCVQVLDYHTGTNKLFKEGDILFEEWDGNLPVTNDSDFGKSVDTPELSAPTMILTGNLEQKGGEIAFKIGLSNKYTPNETNPARYARVLVSYGGNSQGYRYHNVLWLRQGENADYVMPTEDTFYEITKNDGKIVAINTIPRTNARKWSPYNLTPDAWSTIGNNFKTVEKVQLYGRDSSNPTGYDYSGGEGPGVFVPYPTMAGAHFHWVNEYATDHERLAFNPGLPQITSWDNSVGRNYFWNWSEKHETCPPGYRRPIGRISGDPSEENEVALSFDTSTDPYDDMYISGCYADGYFDRLPINGSGAVNDGTNIIARVGHLVVNNNDASSRKNASLFFPLAGIRFWDGAGVITNTNGLSGEGHYWTTQVFNNGKRHGGASFSFRDTTRNTWTTGSCTNASSVRCVKE